MVDKSIGARKEYRVGLPYHFTSGCREVYLRLPFEIIRICHTAQRNFTASWIRRSQISILLSYTLNMRRTYHSGLTNFEHLGSWVLS
jgi:hypothetical protein